MQKLLYGVGGLVALLIIIGLALPRSHRVEVSTEIDAHPATVFALLNDFRRFELWSPLSAKDPNVRIVYSGEQAGAGATMSWDGTTVGSGTQTIVESRPYERVDILLNPGEPGEARSDFSLAPGTGTTIVSWGFETDFGMNLVGRYFAGMFGAVIARDYQAGLTGLKQLAESLPAADFSGLDVEHTVVDAAEIAYLPTKSQPDPDAKSEAMSGAFFQIMRFIDEQQLEVAGAPLSVTHTFSGAELLFDVAVPVRAVSESLQREGTSVKLGHSYGGTAIRVRHVGSYRTLGETHRKISAYLVAHGFERNGAAWESYVSDPGTVPEAELLTVIYYPVKPVL